MTDSFYAVLSRLQAQDFHTAVYLGAQLIPAGKVLGYGHLASMIERARVRATWEPPLAGLLPETSSNMVPWWRVVRSDGSIAMQGDVTRGPRQIALLQQELVPFTSPHKVNMRWLVGFQSWTDVVLVFLFWRLIGCVAAPTFVALSERKTAHHSSSPPDTWGNLDPWSITW